MRFPKSIGGRIGCLSSIILLLGVPISLILWHLIQNGNFTGGLIVFGIASLILGLWPGIAVSRIPEVSKEEFEQSMISAQDYRVLANTTSAV